LDKLKIKVREKELARKAKSARRESIEWERVESCTNWNIIHKAFNFV
jgi:hypothetical protein